MKKIPKILFISLIFNLILILNVFASEDSNLTVEEVIKNGKALEKFKTLLVFNNNKNILGLTAESIKNTEYEIKQEIEPQKETIVEKEKIKEKET